MSRRAVQLLRAIARRVRRGARTLRWRARMTANRRRRPGDTALIRAVRAGNLARVEDLVGSGAPLDATDARGQTALHIATLLGRSDVAACLLAHGADHTLRDAHGRAALEPEMDDVEILHSIRQHYQRYPAPSGLAPSEDAALLDTVAELRTSGIAKLPSVIDAPLLAQLRRDFAAFMDELQCSLDRGKAKFEHYDQEQYYWSSELAYVTNNAFKHSASLARLCCSSPITDIVTMYLQKQWFIQRAVAMRYIPDDISGSSAFRYHHDLVDRRLKVMVLLTDITDEDQHMTYVRGSHALFHPYKMFGSNECPLEYCEQRLDRLDIARTIGNAGDAFLFDSNGAHMGNRRSSSRTRDAFFVEFSAARTPQYGGDIPPELFEEMTIGESHPLHLMATLPALWERPFERGTIPSWIVDLPRLDTWIWPTSHRDQPATDPLL